MSELRLAVETRFQMLDLLEANGVQPDVVAEARRILSGKVAEAIKTTVWRAVAKSCSSEGLDVEWSEMYASLPLLGLSTDRVARDDILAALRLLESERKVRLLEVDTRIAIRVVPIVLSMEVPV